MTKQKQYGLRQTKIELAASFKHLSNYKNKIITRLKNATKTSIPIILTTEHWPFN